MTHRPDEALGTPEATIPDTTSARPETVPADWSEPALTWLVDRRAGAGGVRFWLRGVPRSFSNDHRHWRAKKVDTDRWKQLAYFAAAQARITAEDATMRIIPSRKLGDRRRVRLVAYRCQLLDPDNLRGSLKPVLDGLKNMLIVDDAGDWIELEEDQVRVHKRAEERVLVEVRLP